MRKSKNELVVFKVKRRSSKPAPDSDYWFQTLPLHSNSGVTITEEIAMNYAAVYACVRVLAETVSSLPLFLYEKVGKGKEKAEGNPIYTMLHDKPNPEMTSMQYRECQMVHLNLWGNHYSEIERSLMGDPIALWPLNPVSMQVKRDDFGRLVYVYALPSGEIKRFPPELILHIPALGWNGLIGQAPLTFSRQALGLGIAAEEFGSRFFANDGTPGGVLEHPSKLTPDSRQNLKKSWEAAHTGLSQAHRIAILEEGLKFNKITIPANDAQWLETRKFQVLEICRFFRVQPHMIQDLERATWSNIEQQGIDFVTHSIRPWCVRIEQAINFKLLKPPYFSEHLLDSLLRGDTQTRYSAYSVGRSGGWLSVNEIRSYENLNPIKGGDEYQLTPAGAAPNPEKKVDTEDNTEENKNE